VTILTLIAIVTPSPATAAGEVDHQRKPGKPA
jgi:hypothetical protein